MFDQVMFEGMESQISTPSQYHFGIELTGWCHKSRSHRIPWRTGVLV